MILKKFFAAAAAFCMLFCVTGCTQNDVSTGQEETTTTVGTILPKVKEEETESETVSETTSAPQNAEIGIETLAEGEERDYSIEDTLKNDLQIDGIPVSIPCTVNELLDALGEDYSIDEDMVRGHFYGVATESTKYFTGEQIPVELYFKGEGTGGFIKAIAEPNGFDCDTANVVGFFAGFDKGELSFTDLSAGGSVNKCSDKYGEPVVDEVYSSDSFTFYLYSDEDCWFRIAVRANDSDVIYKIHEVGFQTERLVIVD
ncbi:MAG: hypothetical protein NC395_00650 [Prevotella sp.]|nr:hypothetical protein [Prevotella sp.]